MSLPPLRCPIDGSALDVSTEYVSWARDTSVTGIECTAWPVHQWTPTGEPKEDNG